MGPLHRIVECHLSYVNKRPFDKLLLLDHLDHYGRINKTTEILIVAIKAIKTHRLIKQGHKASATSSQIKNPDYHQAQH